MQNLTCLAAKGNVWYKSCEATTLRAVEVYVIVRQLFVVLADDLRQISGTWFSLSIKSPLCGL